LKDDILLSVSWDSSIKVWTVLRAVELNTFKSFDDGVSYVRKTSFGFSIGMTNVLIEYSPFENFILRLNNFPGRILGFQLSNQTFYIATKTGRSVSVYYKPEISDSFAPPLSSYDNYEFCSAFVSQPDFYAFWFGFRDGSIVKYSIGNNTFQVVVCCLYCKVFVEHKRE
jgi:WD40 repeat protein